MAKKDDLSGCFAVLLGLIGLVIYFLYQHPIIAAVVLGSILVIIYLIYQGQKREKEVSVRIESIRKRRDRKEERIREQAEKQLVELVGKEFNVSKCPRCNENLFQLFKVGSSGSAVQIKCVSCDKQLWVKSISSECPEAAELYWKVGGESLSDLGPYIEAKKVSLSNQSRERIPESVRSEVWNRDGGRCIKCGSNENLEFDHIIPVSKGGANTARNIQLLCEKCNREKGASI